MTESSGPNAADVAREIVLKHVPRDIAVSHVNMDWLQNLSDDITTALISYARAHHAARLAEIEEQIDIAGHAIYKAMRLVTAHKPKVDYGVASNDDEAKLKAEIARRMPGEEEIRDYFQWSKDVKVTTPLQAFEVIKWLRSRILGEK